MTHALVIVDTNVVVSGLVTGDRESPPFRILDAMLDGSLRFVVSEALVSEYLVVLRRPGIARLHRLTEQETEAVLGRIVANARVVETGAPSEAAPDRGDQHLWDLLDAVPDAWLVTGDARLRRSRRKARIVSPAELVAANDEP